MGMVKEIRSAQVNECRSAQRKHCGRVKMVALRNGDVRSWKGYQFGDGDIPSWPVHAHRPIKTRTIRDGEGKMDQPQQLRWVKVWSVIGGKRGDLVPYVTEHTKHMHLCGIGLPDC